MRLVWELVTKTKTVENRKISLSHACSYKNPNLLASLMEQSIKKIIDQNKWHSKWEMQHLYKISINVIHFNGDHFTNENKHITKSYKHSL